MTSRPAEHAALPTFVPPAAVAGQVDLILDGVYGPGRAAVVALPTQTGKQAEEAGGVLLCDEEGAPFAAMTLGADGGTDAVPTGEPMEPEDSDRTELTGTLARLGDPHARPFAPLRRTPGELRSELGGNAAIAVATARPLVRTETDEIVATATDTHAQVVVLPLTAVQSGPPSDVLVRAVRSGAELLSTPAGPAFVVPLPIPGASRGPREFARASGMTFHGELDPGRWGEIRAALDGAPQRLEDLVGTGAAAALREWRPPRAARGLTVFFTGLSGSGKSTVARGVAEVIRDRGRTVTSVDGDVVRRLLSAGLTFSRADRDLNILRIGWVASEITRHRGVAVCAPIAPYAATRSQVRDMVEANGDFVLVHVSTPLEVCEQRDRKGLYARARAGLIENFTGITDPYEEPDDADLALDTSTMSVDDAVSRVVTYLERSGWLPTE